MLELMLPALVASLILVAIHAYLGIHIIARGVIFVDLAIAQTAAMGWAAASLGLGSTLGGWLGISEGAAGYGIGLAATLIAAGLFSATRMEHDYIPQEAIIGIVYVVATAATILLAAQAPRGAEHVEQLLTGTLLWVTWPQIWRTAGVYAAIGATHWIFRERFMTITLNPAEARRRGWRLAAWDLLFYALFGLVVTLSVAIAGVLVVFSFLVIPAVIAFLFTNRPGRLIGIACLAGTLATLVGLYSSYEADWPTGPTVVVAFAIALLLAYVLRVVLRQLGAPAPVRADAAAGE